MANLERDYDVLVIGSGFGGSVTALRLTEKGYKVGVIEAGMFPQLLEQGQFDQKWIDETLHMLALKRWGKAEDIGRAAVFLASNNAAYITGQQLNVSGGYGI